MRQSAGPRGRDTGMVRLYVWVMIVAAGLTVAVALLSTRTDPLYAASAEVLIDPTITPSGSYIQPSMPTEQRVATSTDVVGTAAARLGVTPAQALEKLSVTVPVDTQVLVISYTADTPAAAWAGATAMSQTYLQNRNPRDGDEAVATLVGPPQVPSTPMATNYPVVLGVAVLGGLLTGCAAAWTWDRVRGRIRTIADAERRTDLDAVAVLPRSPRRSSADDLGISPVRSHLDPLAARVLGLVEDRPRPTVLMTGVGPGCGSTTAAVQTAFALARMGRTVLLVTADQDVITRLASGPEPTGAADRPSTDLCPEPSTTRPAGLHLVPVSEWDGGGVAAAKLANLLPELHDRLPEALVVIDGPPAWQSAGMALRADRILLVVALGRSSRTATTAAAQALDHCAEKLVGLVVRPRQTRGRVPWGPIRARAALRASRAMVHVAPPEPAAAAPIFPATAARDLDVVVPLPTGTAADPVRKARPGALLALAGWTGPLGREDHLSTAISADRMCAFEPVAAPRPSRVSTRSSSS